MRRYYLHLLRAALAANDQLGQDKASQRVTLVLGNWRGGITTGLLHPENHSINQLANPLVCAAKSLAFQDC